MTTRTEQADEKALVVTLAGPLRRIVAAGAADPHLVDDVVQETLVRVLVARDRVAADALLPYAVVTARNLVTSRARRSSTAQRNASRLVDLVPPRGPEEAVLQQEEAQALRQALRSLPDRDRDALIAHEVHGVDTKAMAESTSSTPGGIAAQLARARARMRVEYVLALRRVDLPTSSCRSVLLALSMGDRRRQQSLDAGSHLLDCATCAELSQPLLARKRALAGVLPVGVVAWLAGLKSSGAVGPFNLAQVGAGAAATAVAATVVVLGVAGGDGKTPPKAEPRLVLGTGHPVVSREELTAAAAEDQPVSADDARVLAVPADEGFWIGNGAGRTWVQLSASGESDPQIRPSQRLDFSAQPVAHQPGFARQVGLRAGADARALDRQQIHLQVDTADVTRS